mmetsp:Transcript_58358/g.153251  ORF Transcript_58358/g.153251 Transcript_58358/m.153251 type:complete len:240 (-) Transcript_58358:15-734(-)
MRFNCSMSSGDAPGSGSSAGGPGAGGSRTALPAPPAGAGGGGGGGGSGPRPPAGPSSASLPVIVSVELRRVRSDAKRSSSTVTPSSMSVYSLAIRSSRSVSSTTRRCSSSSSSAASLMLQYTRPPPIPIVASAVSPLMLASDAGFVGTGFGGAFAASACCASGDRISTLAAPTKSAFRTPPTTRRQMPTSVLCAARTAVARAAPALLGHRCVGSTAGRLRSACEHGAARQRRATASFIA